MATHETYVKDVDGDTVATCAVSKLAAIGFDPECALSTLDLACPGALHIAPVAVTWRPEKRPELKRWSLGWWGQVSCYFACGSHALLAIEAAQCGHPIDACMRAVTAIGFLTMGALWKWNQAK